MITRRDFFNGLAAVSVVAGLGAHARRAGAEPPPETTRIRLIRITGICIAPQELKRELKG